MDWHAQRAAERINRPGAGSDPELAESLTALFRACAGSKAWMTGLPRGVEAADIVQDCLENAYRQIASRADKEKGEMTPRILGGFIKKSVAQRIGAAWKRHYRRYVNEVPYPTDRDEVVMDTVFKPGHARLSEIILREEIGRLTRRPGMRASEISVKLGLAIAESLEAQGDTHGTAKQLREVQEVEARKVKASGTVNRARRAHREEMQRDFAM